jgi:hypothetical protein
MDPNKARRRFYNQALGQSVYEQCLLATENRFKALNTISADEYYVDGKQAKNKSWTQTTYVPPVEWQQPLHLSAPFRSFDPGGGKKEEANKRAKREGSKRTTSNLGEEEPKLKVPFTRSIALEGQMSVYKVRMLPTRLQKVGLKRCFGVARHAYNFANYLVRRYGDQVNFIKLLNLWTKEPPLPWGLNVATRIQQHAIKECADAYTSNIARAKLLPGIAWEVKYQELHSTQTEVIVIQKDQNSDSARRVHFEAIPLSAGGRRSECLLHLGNNLAKHCGILLQDSQGVIERLLKESGGLKENIKILWNKGLNWFYFLFSYEQPKLEDPDPLFEHTCIVATDQGLSPFQEWYLPTTGEYGVLLDCAKPEKYQRCLALDRLQSRVAHRRKGSQGRRQTTRMCRKRYRRECARMSNWMENGHYAAAHSLLEKHNVIIQPVLQVKALADTTKRTLHSRAVRAMYTWGHHKFCQHLKSAESRYPGRYVFETTEPGTSENIQNWFKHRFFPLS